MTKPLVDLGKYGIWYGNVDALTTPVAQDAARTIEGLGFTTMWVAEAVGRDPFVSSSVLLSATSTLKLATGIAKIYARDPMTMLAGQNTVAEAFPGRFLLGLGVSHGHLVAGVRKHDYSKPYSYMVVPANGRIVTLWPSPDCSWRTRISGDAPTTWKLPK